MNDDLIFEWFLRLCVVAGVVPILVGMWAGAFAIVRSVARACS